METQSIKTLTGNLTQISQHNQKSKAIKHIFIGITLSILLFTAVAAWHHHQSQPLTEAQQTQLSNLVGQVAQQTHQTRHKVWAQVKILLQVRRIRDIKRKDFDKAWGLLLQGMK